MIKGGVITGLVTNAKGEPIVGVPVHATLQNAQPSVVSFLTGGNMSETDDRGIYRIYGLLPGQYTVRAGSTGQFGQFIANGFDIDVPTYYPSSTRDTAIPVSVRSGDETSGIDIKYQGHGRSFNQRRGSGQRWVGPPRRRHNNFAGTGGFNIGVCLWGSPPRWIPAARSASMASRDGEYDLLASYYGRPERQSQ